MPHQYESIKRQWTANSYHQGLNESVRKFNKPNRQEVYDFQYYVVLPLIIFFSLLVQLCTITNL